MKYGYTDRTIDLTEMTEDMCNMIYFYRKVMKRKTATEPLKRDIALARELLEMMEAHIEEIEKK